MPKKNDNIIGVGFFILLIGFFIVGSQIDANNKQKTKDAGDMYNNAFGGISGNSFQENNFEYNKQDKLYIYYNGKWTDKVSHPATFYESGKIIPKNYLSKTPSDLGGILIVNEKTRSAKSGNGVPVSLHDYDIKLLDPYNKIIVETSFFECYRKPPIFTRSNGVDLYANLSEITDWINKTWSEYCNTRN